jgi:hypothetical protein
MPRPTPDQVVEYWHRSYRTVDGLWFMKVEERYGFDTALEIDNDVWAVMAKIQARACKSMLGLTGSFGDLFEAVKAKLELEGYEFAAEREGDERFRLVISYCPWHAIMLRSNRGHLSGRVGTLICSTEYRAWAAEFGGGISVGLGDQICEGCDACVITFSALPSGAG